MGNEALAADDEDVEAGVAGRGDAHLAQHRVEHRPGDGPTIDWGLIVCATHHTALAPFVAHLALAGRVTGELVLLDEATGAVVARRSLTRSPRRGWQRAGARDRGGRGRRPRPPTASAG